MVFWGKRKREEEPRNHLACPYCGKPPIAVRNRNPPYNVLYYRCGLGCLQGESASNATDAFEAWIRIVARFYDAEDAIRKNVEQKEGKQE